MTSNKINPKKFSDLDSLCTFETSTLPASLAPTRFAVRQVLDQELHRTIALRENTARQARFQAGALPGTKHVPRASLALAQDKDRKKDAIVVKKDFFGRIIEAQPLAAAAAAAAELDARSGKGVVKEENKVWVTYHEGLNNAVRKSISLKDFLRVL